MSTVTVTDALRDVLAQHELSFVLVEFRGGAAAGHDGLPRARWVIVDARGRRGRSARWRCGRIERELADALAGLPDPPVGTRAQAAVPRPARR